MHEAEKSERLRLAQAASLAVASSELPELDQRRLLRGQLQTEHREPASNLGITSVYLQGNDNAEIIETVHARRAPMITVSASLPL